MCCFPINFARFFRFDFETWLIRVVRAILKGFNLGNFDRCLGVFFSNGENKENFGGETSEFPPLDHGKD